MWTIGILCRAPKTWLTKSKLKKKMSLIEGTTHQIDQSLHSTGSRIIHTWNINIKFLFPLTATVFIFSMVSYSVLSMLHLEISLLFPNQRVLRDIFLKAFKIVLLFPANGWKHAHMKCSQDASLGKDVLATVFKVLLKSTLFKQSSKFMPNTPPC